MIRLAKGLTAALVMTTLTVPALTGAARAQQVEEIVVRAPGPALWKISRGASTVWLLGTSEMISRDQAWNSTRLSGVLDRARALIPPLQATEGYLESAVPASARQLEGRSLDDLPEPLRSRYFALRAKLGLDLHRYDGLKPAWAAILLLRDVRSAAALTDAEPSTTIASLAQAKHVRILPPPKVDASAIADELGRLPTDAGRGVLADAVDAAEHQLTHAHAASAAWARGDVATVRANAGPEDLETWVLRRTIALKRVQDRRVTATVAAINASLDRPGETVMVARMPLLVRHGAALDRLRAHGVTVVSPTESPVALAAARARSDAADAPG